MGRDFCHKCGKYTTWSRVEIGLDGEEAKYDADYVKVPVCSKCKRPVWEVMARENCYCEPRKVKNLPGWTKADDTRCLKAIAVTRSDIKEVYTVATVEEIIDHCKNDLKNTAPWIDEKLVAKALAAKAMAHRARLLEVLEAKKTAAPVPPPAPVVRKADPKKLAKAKLYKACYEACRKYRETKAESDLSAWNKAKRAFAAA